MQTKSASSLWRSFMAALLICGIPASKPVFDPLAEACLQMIVVFPCNGGLWHTGHRVYL